MDKVLVFNICDISNHSGRDELFNNWILYKYLENVPLFKRKNFTFQELHIAHFQRESHKKTKTLSSPHPKNK